MTQAKTNAQRMLEREKIPYLGHHYETSDGANDGVSVAEKVGIPPERVFKTLVTQNQKKSCFVFVIPVAKELSLKAAARAVGEKSIEMLPVKELLARTGYVKGGCSPIGMKKPFPTVIDMSAEAHERIVVSAGKLGEQIEAAPADLARVCNAHFAVITA